jgi:NTE family protein
MQKCEQRDSSEFASRCQFSLLVFVLLISLGGGAAQTAAPKAPQNPSIGLVLEGGGALGLAHVGVIRWLEEHRIPVSYIAGTSMGGLVGGAYATGKNAAEVREVVDRIDWNQVIGGQTPFEDLSFRRKQDAHEFPSTLEFGLHKGLQFPSGFNSGQQVSLILDEIALPYYDLHSFDDLPIPFACVAVDLVDQKEHIFRSGSLALALRSTMSLPGIFTPIRHDGHIYVDGGLLNNFPSSVVRQMGADLVLGVHLETTRLKSDASLSTLSVLDQSISVVIAENERRAMRDADILVTVPLQKYSSMDFNQAKSIIDAGYQAAAANADKLTPLSVDEESWQRYLKQRQARQKKAAVPLSVKVAGVTPDIAEPLAKGMLRHVGHPVETAELNHEMIAMSGTGPFSNANYSMKEQDGKPGLEIEAVPKPYSPPLVRPVINIDGSSYNNVFFSLGARITFFNFGGYRRELRNDVIFGSQYGITSEYYRPFTPTSSWFVAPRGGFNSIQYPLFSGDTLLALYRNREALGGLDLGYAFGRTGELRLGYEGGYRKLTPQIGNSSQLPTVSGVTQDVRLQVVFNTLDQSVIPRRGSFLKFYTKYYLQNPAAPHGFPLSEAQFQNFFRVSKPSSIFLNASGGSSYGFKTGIPAFGLGGTTRFVAFGTNELLTNQYFVFQTGYIRTLKTLPPLLGSTIDFLGMFEIGKTYQLPSGPKPPNLPRDVAGALIVNTLFGPVETGVAVGNYGHAKFFFQIGRVF